MARTSAPSFPASALLPVVAFGGAMLAGALLKSSPRRTSFRDQVVLITGGSRGLGLALAERFAVESAQIVLVARSQDQLERAAERVRARGAASVLIRVCDIRDRAGVERAVADTIRERGRIDVLVNNAGIIQVTPFEHAQLEDFPFISSGRASPISLRKAAAASSTSRLSAGASRCRTCCRTAWANSPSPGCPTGCTRSSGATTSS
ncbi:MAG: SDR family NAD(P)-dependent oxidoreductase [Acidobacteria bacterium]|nr:SDR family NAD(P)-dependent oxidoreductase [Acidobacteriota bacterium]